ncbi:MAG: DUF2920 family protein [Paenibacillaceae bacterium]
MAKEHNIKVPAHPSIYQSSNREITVYFCEPEQGINKDTGLLLLIPNFGDTAASDISTQMRSSFADTYNMVTVQCEYFGQEFMGVSSSPQFNFDTQALQGIITPEEFDRVYKGNRIDVNELLQVGVNYSLNIVGIEQFNETLENFNDMGIMQALDHLSALQVVAEILKDNEYVIHAGKVMVYGTGHGAYLAYLCNAFAPKLFSLLIDYSGWLFPSYLETDRSLTYRSGKTTMTIVFQYLAKRTPFDKELLHLSSLYKHINNSCNIFSFHNSNDPITTSRHKQALCQSIKNCMYSELTEADPIAFFNYVMQNVKVPFQTSNELNLPLNIINTKKYRYTFDYSGGVPVLTRQEKK